MKEIKPIKAYAVVASRLDDYYIRGGNDWALAIFRTKKEAIWFSKGCNSGYGEQQPHVIKVEINHLTH